MGCVLPVLTARELYSSSRHQGLLAQFKSMIVLSDADFERLYPPVFNRFAEFVQVIPNQANGVLSSLLNEGLSRAVLAVTTALIESQELVDPLFIYATFTAALLRDVAKLMTTHVIIITTEGGEFITPWQPLENSSMVGKGEFYKLYPLAPIYTRLESSLVLLLARQMMTTEGFLWITKDFPLFADWLDALRGDKGQGGRVTHVLDKMKREDVYNLINALVQIDVDMVPAKDTPYGDLFYAWLRDGIEKGSIPVNATDGGVHMVKNGLFLEKNKIFQHFAELSKLPVNFNVVFTQFGNLFGIASKGGGDFLHRQHFSGGAFSGPLSGNSHALRDGVVLSNPAMVYKNSQIPAVSSALKATQSALPQSHQVPQVMAETNSQQNQPKLN